MLHRGVVRRSEAAPGRADPAIPSRDRASGRDRRPYLLLSGALSLLPEAAGRSGGIRQPHPKRAHGMEKDAPYRPDLLRRPHRRRRVRRGLHRSALTGLAIQPPLADQRPLSAASDRSLLRGPSGPVPTLCPMAPEDAGSRSVAWS